MVAEDNPSGLVGYAHKLDGGIFWGIGNEILDLAFFSHRGLFEQPRERLEFHSHWRVQSSLDDADSETVLETFPMFNEGIFGTPQPLSEFALSPCLDIP